MGIYGLGRIGAVVASFGRAFGLDVPPWSRPASLERARADRGTPGPAAVDVYEFEPQRDPADPLLTMERSSADPTSAL